MADQAKTCPECLENPSVRGGLCFECNGLSMLDPRGDE